MKHQLHLANSTPTPHICTEGGLELAVLIENIIDRESFEKWLDDQPIEVARAMAVRIALRTLPMVFSVHSIDEPNLTLEIKNDLTLYALRANFISWAAGTYPAHDIKEAAHSAAFSAAHSAFSVAQSAAHSAFSAAVSAANSADSAHSAAFSARSAAFSAANSAAVSAAHSAAFSAAVWRLIRFEADQMVNLGYEAVRSEPLFPLPLDSDMEHAVLQLREAGNGAINDFRKLPEYEANHWGLWLAWYDALQSDTSYSRFGEKIDLEIALKPDEFWDRDAEVVMAELAAIVGWPFEGGEAEQIGIPDQQPAPIEVAVQDGRIVRQQSSHLVSDNGLDQIHRLLLRESISMRDWITPQMAGAGTFFDQLVNELGATLDETNIYGVGFWEAGLQEFSNRIDERFLEDNAARFAGLLLNLDRFLKQSTDWQAYLKKVHDAELDALDRQAAAEQLATVVDELLVETDLIDEGVSGPLAQLKHALLEAQSYNPETAYGFYRSLANVLQVVSELTLTVGVENLKRFAGDVGHDLRNKSVGFVAGSILATVSAGLLYLTGTLPSMFGFLKPLLAAMGLG